ncbi:hypothetical protein L198_00247 [Cryptococcus wingfieldii CBS 7118]|uniref:RFX-type winged-helix domain-containing protein n=1 Tax=Cryptococcus wingfieldii CBS 7118 TaxID=1295528 RepID=A0A1E3K7K9_9TREE|nr:hypothetical protein L198_00247 [Cryptococcus wingfieldii CBS 7118]ODO08517.1 hypothetical protein L198_00247 [Cryptococcus wingfieldii CBS 7118]
MAEPATLPAFSFPPAPLSSSPTDPTSPAGLQFDTEALALTPENEPWDRELEPNMGINPLIDPSSYQPHMLNHAWSNSSLSSFHSTHSNPGLHVSTDSPIEIPSASHSRHSSYSSLNGIDTKMPWNRPPFMDMYPVQHVGEFNPVIATGDLFSASDIKQHPKLAVQTQGLGKIMTTRERSASRSMPYSRQRSESLSIKSEEGDDIASLISASTTYSAHTPWSTTNSIAGGFNDLSLHHRRTSSSTSYTNTPLRTSPPRPMLSRARRSSSMIIPRQQSQSDLSRNEFKLQGSAAERQAVVRSDLTEKADEIKGMSSSSQQDKARALWVRRCRLLMSYTRSGPHTVPRQGLYHSYTMSCDEYGIKPINSASFGKAVRSAYPGIKTRRLGVRGNSQLMIPRKYHYVSIRPAIQIEAERLNDYGDSSGAWHVAPEDGSMDFQSSNDRDMVMDGEDVDDSDEEDQKPFGSLSYRPSQQSLSRDRSTSIHELFTPQRPKAAFTRRHTTSSVNSVGFRASQSHVRVFSLPGFPTLSVAAELGNEVSMESLQSFWNSFCQHEEIIVECIRGYHFDQYEMNCRTFWNSLPPSLVQVCLHPVISSMITEAMLVCYDHIVGILLDKLTSPCPVTSQCSLRALADNLEAIMEESLGIFPQNFSESKVEMSARVAHLFLRFIDLHQLTAALSPILANQSQVRTMITAWENLDVRNVSDQCALSCQCQQDVIEAVLQDFYHWLVEAEEYLAQGGYAIDRLGGWVDKMLRDVQAATGGASLSALVCKVGFVTSQVMRDFTLKSDQTFGLFQLIKTWLDDWVSIAALRKTKLSIGNGSPPVPTYIPAMSVFIPQHDTITNPDLSTAVPFGQGSSQWPQSGLHAHHQPFDGQQGQYLAMPSFGSEHNASTPRPMFGHAMGQQQ